MKIRSNYVSNSSSSSFVVYNWFDIPESKRNYIKDYDKNALILWKENNIPFRTINRGSEPEYEFDECMIDSVIDTNLSDELYDKVYDKFLVYAFGFVNNGIKFEFEEHKDRNTCTIKACMDNFDMENWLKYNKVDFDELEYFV